MQDPKKPKKKMRPEAREGKAIYGKKIGQKKAMKK
jgi:hypothetical protein